MQPPGQPRRQVPANLEQAVIEWANASADLAAVLRQIDFNTPVPQLRLVSCQRSRSGLRSKLTALRDLIRHTEIAALALTVAFWPAVFTHPGFLTPGS